jgi:thiol-disulfide isomerase/thioredoxin
MLWASAFAVAVLAIVTVVAFTAGEGDGDDVQVVYPSGPNQLQGRDVTGERVPDETFERFDLGELSGGHGSLGDYTGRPTVVNFFASWCTPCIVEMPAFEQVHQRLGDDVAFVGVNTGEQPASGQRIIRQTGITYDVLRDQSGTLTQQFEILNMPSTLFVDSNGAIVRVHTGELSESELEQIIRDHLQA